jgi:hypothetical protein
MVVLVEIEAGIPKREEYPIRRSIILILEERDFINIKI